jgi:hypothetical protein
VHALADQHTGYASSSKVWKHAGRIWRVVMAVLHSSESAYKGTGLSDTHTHTHTERERERARQSETRIATYRINDRSPDCTSANANRI